MAEIRTLHITYATPGFVLSSWLLRRSAERYGLFSRAYGPSDPVDVDLRHRYPEIMNQPRGAGYWLWKPHIVRDAMRNAADGDVILYTDAAVIFIADPQPLLGLADQQPIVLFEISGGGPAKAWTKRDCFVGLDADKAEFWDAPMLCATFQLYRVGPEARAFVDALCAASADARVLTDAPNSGGLPNFPEFRDHRHDQSVLTIVARKFGLPLYPDPSQFGTRAPRAEIDRGDGVRRPAAPYGQLIQQHRKKNNKVLQWYARYRFREMIGGA